jgi:hypothetical protein
LESAIAEGALDYDMKRGTADYKYHWANGERRTLEVKAVRRSIRGAWLLFWEYGSCIAALRTKTRVAYCRVRRAVRDGILAISRRLPMLVPDRLLARAVQGVQAEAAARAASLAGDSD